MQYTLKFPGVIRFGCGTRRELAAALPSGPVLVAAGTHAAAAAESLLPPPSERRSRIVTGIRPEPTLADMERLLEAARELDARAVVAVGGGSVIDCAKAAALLLEEDREVPAAEFFYNRRVPAGRKRFFAALPTTAGTGAEITANAVLTDPATSVKQSLRHPSMRADLAIVDPELTYDCPAAVTAASGFDALTQAIEGYLSKNADPVTRMFSMRAARNLMRHLPRAAEGDEAAREPAAEGSMLAAMAFAQCGLGAVHGIGHPAGALLGVPHGVTCAILLPTVLRWNLPACRETMAELAGELTGTAPEELIAELETLRRQLRLPENFRSFGLRAEHYDFIVKHCRSGSMRSNPRDLSDRDVIEILEELT